MNNDNINRDIILILKTLLIITIKRTKTAIKQQFRQFTAILSFEIDFGPFSASQHENWHTVDRSRRRSRQQRKEQKINTVKN
jgi:hypothetical protein